MVGYVYRYPGMVLGHGLLPNTGYGLYLELPMASYLTLSVAPTGVGPLVATGVGTGLHPGMALVSFLTRH